MDGIKGERNGKSEEKLKVKGRVAEGKETWNGNGKSELDETDCVNECKELQKERKPGTGREGVNWKG